MSLFKLSSVKNAFNNLVSLKLTNKISMPPFRKAENMCIVCLFFLGVGII